MIITYISQKSIYSTEIFCLCFASSKSINDCNVETNNTKIAVYILNTSLKKFHYSLCSSAKKIKNENYQKYIGDKEELIKMKYTAVIHKIK